MTFQGQIVDMNTNTVFEYLRDDTKDVGSGEGPIILKRYEELCNNSSLSRSYSPVNSVLLFDVAPHTLNASAVLLDNLSSYEEMREAILDAKGSSIYQLTAPTISQLLAKRKFPGKQFPQLHDAIGELRKSVEKCLDIIEYVELRDRYEFDEIKEASQRQKPLTKNPQLAWQHLLEFKIYYDHPEAIGPYFEQVVADCGKVAEQLTAVQKILEQRPLSTSSNGFPRQAIHHFSLESAIPRMMAMVDTARQLAFELRQDVGKKSMSETPFAFGRVNDTAAVHAPNVVSLFPKKVEAPAIV